MRTKMTSVEGVEHDASPASRQALIDHLVELTSMEDWNELEAQIRALDDPTVLFDVVFDEACDPATILCTVCGSPEVPVTLVQALLDCGGSDLVTHTVRPACSSNRLPSLHVAILTEGSSFEIARLLLRTNPASLRISDRFGLLPLDVAATRIMTIEERLKYPYALSTPDFEDDETHHLEALWEMTMEMLHAFTPDGVPEEQPALHTCIYAGSNCPVSLHERCLKRHRHELTLTDFAGNTPLHIAVMTWPSLQQCDDQNDNHRHNDDEEIITDLLKACPEAVSIRNRDRMLPLDLAIDARRSWEGVLRPLFEMYPEALAGRDIPAKHYPHILAELNRKNVSIGTLNRIVNAKPELFQPARWDGDCDCDVHVETI